MHKKLFEETKNHDSEKWQVKKWSKLMQEFFWDSSMMDWGFLFIWKKSFFQAPNPKIYRSSEKFLL